MFDNNLLSHDFYVKYFPEFKVKINPTHLRSKERHHDKTTGHYISLSANE